MLSNFKRVLQVLSHSQLDECSADHDTILSLVASDFIEDVSIPTLVNLYEKDDFQSDEYWTPIFEAYLLAHYDAAHEIVIECLTCLHNRRFSVVNRCIPAVMVGSLRAANAEKDKGNEEFHLILPSFLGRLLLSYEDGAGSRESKSAGMWFFGQFSNEFKRYFNGSSGEHSKTYLKRIADFCVELDETRIVTANAQKLFDEVVSDLIRIMPRPMAAKAIAKAWLGAKNLNDINEGRQTKLFMEDHKSTFDKLHQRVT